MIRNVIGVDLGTSYVAYATLKIPEEVFEYAFIKFKPDLPSADLHRHIVQVTRDLYTWPSVSRAFVEGVFMGLNARTFSRMTRVSHSIQIALAEEHIPSEVIDPKAWRRVLFGNHLTKKEDGLQWAEEHVPGLEGVPKNRKEHLSEAAMIALAGRKLIESGQHNGSGPIRSGKAEGMPQ